MRPDVCIKKLISTFPIDLEFVELLFEMNISATRCRFSSLKLMLSKSFPSLAVSKQWADIFSSNMCLKKFCAENIVMNQSEDLLLLEVKPLQVLSCA